MGPKSDGPTLGCVRYPLWGIGSEGWRIADHEEQISNRKAQIADHGAMPPLCPFSSDEKGEVFWGLITQGGPEE